MVDLRSVHLVAIKHVMRYLKGKIDYGLRYASNCEIILQGFTDSNWVSSVVDQNSKSKCCFSVVSTMISWFNRKQTSVALSMIEAHYIATCSASNKEVWLQKFLARLFDLELEATCI